MNQTPTEPLRVSFLSRRGRAILLGLLLGALAGPASPVRAETLSSAEPATRIIGGVEARVGTYPWMVAIVSAAAPTDFLGQYCGGSLVGANWVLTAAHCVWNSDQGTSVSPQSIVAVLGKHRLSDTGGERLPVAQIVVHPRYNPSASDDSDVALLRLAKASSMPPVQVAQPYSKLVRSGVLATTMGWGYTFYDPLSGGFAPSDELREVDLPILSNAECVAMFDAAGLPIAITGNMLCAGYPQGRRDSGGPLVVPNAQGTSWVQAGVTSFGFGCALPDQPGVYTRLSQFKEGFISPRVCGARMLAAPRLTYSFSGTRLTARWTSVAGATGYTAYFAPEPARDPWRSAELGNASTRSVNLRSGQRWVLAIQAHAGNCNGPTSTLISLRVP